MVAESEERLFWCTLVQGYASIPSFFMLLMVSCNTLLSLLFASLQDLTYDTGTLFFITIFQYRMRQQASCLTICQQWRYVLASWACLYMCAGLDSLGRTLFQVAFTSIILRNLLVSFYELMIDTVTSFPLVNPTMLRRFRSGVARRPSVLAVAIVLTRVYSQKSNPLISPLLAGGSRYISGAPRSFRLFPHAPLR